MLPCLTSIVCITNQMVVTCSHSQTLKGSISAPIHYKYEGHHKCKATQLLEMQREVARKLALLGFLVSKSYPTEVGIFHFDRKFILCLHSRHRLKPSTCIVVRFPLL